MSGDEIVAGLGGEEAVTEARQRNQAYIDGHRLAERRKALGLAQAAVARADGRDQEPRLARSSAARCPPSRQSPATS